IRRLKKDQSKIRYKKRITSDLMITPFGDILQRVPVYAPEKFAKRLNRTFGQSKLKGALSFGKDDKYSIIDVATKYNAIIKANILQSSLFHHFAFTRSYLFGGAIRNIKDINVFRAYKDGLQAIQELNPTIELLVRNGLTLGRIQDWEELVFKQHTFIGDLLDKWKVSKAVKDRVLLFREKQARSLFQRYGAGLKAYTAMLEYQRMLHEHPGLHPNDRAKYVANLVNDDFGGLHLQRLGISPTRQHIFRLFALAPDWTESNIRTMVKAVKAGPKEQKQLYRKFWRRVAVRAMTLTTVLNLAMALFDDPDDEETYWVTVKRRYKTAWDRGYLSWLDVDISPVYFALGGDRDKRTYFSVIGHFRDPVKFLRYPAMSAKNKGSVLSRVILESLVGSDWRGRPFTNWDELAGLDDGKWTPSYKGLYKTTSKKFGYKKGDPKGGTLKGRLTKSRYQGKFGPIDYGQVPSFTVHQIKQMMPIQIQMLIGYLLGEEQGLEALLKSLGIGSAVVLDPKYYKNSETQKPETQKQTLKRPVRSERPVRKRLIRKAG
ncbi:hypothetical protein JXQ31_13690, partial [candidate division KSB1 bacterium]|nr:hypothetical protein [candidate division KSB1 bacterium]